MKKPALRPVYKKPANQQQLQLRTKIILSLAFLAFLFLWARFFYLQIFQGQHYNQLAQNQYQQLVSYQGERGKIYTSDNQLLVGNQQVYQLYFEPATLNLSLAEFYQLISPIILVDPEASASLKTLETLSLQAEAKKTRGIVAIANNLNQDSKDQLSSLPITGLQFQAKTKRFYPEKNMAAHTLGFLSKDKSEGHYGIEGGLNKELESKNSQSLVTVDGFKSPIFTNSNLIEDNLAGRDIYLTLRKDIQILVEDSLATAMQKYGASRGEIIVMDPKTGAILGLATAPNYDPDKYYQAETSLYKNPAIVDLFEPGSTFKILTVAAGIDAGLISPYTPCTRCSGPRTIDKYTIRTWNDVYHPNIDMTQALEKSDNIAMIFISDLLGGKRLREYLQKFGIGEKLNLGTQEEVAAIDLEKWAWGPTEVATRSFGQGISLSSLQLLRAVGAIANEGRMMQPYLVSKAVDKATGEVFVTQPQVLSQVVSEETAKTVSKMLQQAAQHGEAQYIYKNTDSIAGKTGTAQIATKGGYEKNDTIASFIGFAPYDDPKFIMFVKFERPRSSPWAAETAAPTFKDIAEKLYLIFGLN